jgi:adenylate kinase family enzyme
MPKVALYNKPGAGKSTFAGPLAQELTAASSRSSVSKGALS